MANIEQLERLIKRLFIADYLHYGLFPCQSDVVRLIRADKREWDNNNDKFEYKVMPLPNANASGNLELQTYYAKCGTVSNSINIDTMINLETKDKKAAFENDYATCIHDLRNNVATLFKNFAIHGRFGVVHQLRASIAAPNIGEAQNPQANTGFTPTIGVPFTIKTPINVFNSNFKKGKLLIKTTEVAPWGAADVAEMYMVLDNQPNLLALLPCGTAVSDWEDGQFLEVAQNREIVGKPADIFNNWTAGQFPIESGPFVGKYNRFNGTGAYTSGKYAITGAMEGLADLFPWYTDPANMDTRLGLDMPFRGQPNRQGHLTEQAGNWVLQEWGEHIINAIMKGFDCTNKVVSNADIGIWINLVTRAHMAQEEGKNVQVLRENSIELPIPCQRSVKTTDYQIGNYILKEVVEDMNMPTDVIIIGPKNDMSYNCWDNATFEIDKCIQETWNKSEPPKIDDLQDALVDKVDLSQRIRIEDNIGHHGNVVYIEMGALFTVYSHAAYTVVKLREPICDLPTT